MSFTTQSKQLTGENVNGSKVIKLTEENVFVEIGNMSQGFQ